MLTKPAATLAKSHKVHTLEQAAQRGLKVAITEAAKSIGVPLDNIQPSVDVCVFMILRELREKKESSEASVRGPTTAQSYLTTPQTLLMPPLAIELLYRRDRRAARRDTRWR